MVDTGIRIDYCPLRERRNFGPGACPEGCESVQDISRHACVAGREPRDPCRRGSRARRRQRLRQVDPDQDARRIPPRRPRCTGMVQRRAVRPGRGDGLPARPAALRTPGPRLGARARRDGQPRAAPSVSTRPLRQHRLESASARGVRAATTLRGHHGPPQAAVAGDAGGARRGGDRGCASELGGRTRRARARRADGRVAAARGRAPLRDRRGGPALGNKRPLRLAPHGRDLRDRRPRHRPPWRRADRDGVRLGGDSVRPRQPDGGEDVEADYRAEVGAVPDSSVALEARNLVSRFLRGTNVVVRKGEIVGLAGLPGSGREELPYVLSGALPADRRDAHAWAGRTVGRRRRGAHPGPAARPRRSQERGPRGRVQRAREPHPAAARPAQAAHGTQPARREPAGTTIGSSGSRFAPQASTPGSRLSAAGTSRRSSSRAVLHRTHPCCCCASRPRASTSAPASRSTT